MPESNQSPQDKRRRKAAAEPPAAEPDAASSQPAGQPPEPVDSATDPVASQRTDSAPASPTGSAPESPPKTPRRKVVVHQVDMSGGSPTAEPALESAPGPAPESAPYAEGARRLEPMPSRATSVREAGRQEAAAARQEQQVQRRHERQSERRQRQEMSSGRQARGMYADSTGRLFRAFYADAPDGASDTTADHTTAYHTLSYTARLQQLADGQLSMGEQLAEDQTEAATAARLFLTETIPDLRTALDTEAATIASLADGDKKKLLDMVVVNAKGRRGAVKLGDAVSTMWKPRYHSKVWEGYHLVADWVGARAKQVDDLMTRLTAMESSDKTVADQVAELDGDEFQDALRELKQYVDLLEVNDVKSLVSDHKQVQAIQRQIQRGQRAWRDLVKRQDMLGTLSEPVTKIIGGKERLFPDELAHKAWLVEDRFHPEVVRYFTSYTTGLAPDQEVNFWDWFMDKAEEVAPVADFRGDHQGRINAILTRLGLGEVDLNDRRKVKKLNIVAAQDLAVQALDDAPYVGNMRSSFRQVTGIFGRKFRAELKRLLAPHSAPDKAEAVEKLRLAAVSAQRTLESNLFIKSILQGRTIRDVVEDRDADDARAAIQKQLFTLLDLGTSDRPQLDHMQALVANLRSDRENWQQIFDFKDPAQLIQSVEEDAGGGTFGTMQAALEAAGALTIGQPGGGRQQAVADEAVAAARAIASASVIGAEPSADTGVERFVSPEQKLMNRLLAVTKRLEKVLPDSVMRSAVSDGVAEQYPIEKGNLNTIEANVKGMEYVTYFFENLQLLLDAQLKKRPATKNVRWADVVGFTMEHPQDATRKIADSDMIKNYVQQLFNGQLLPYEFDGSQPLVVIENKAVFQELYAVINNPEQALDIISEIILLLSRSRHMRSANFNPDTVLWKLAQHIKTNAAKSPELNADPLTGLGLARKNREGAYALDQQKIVDLIDYYATH